ncbi:MAG: VOC family protein [Bacteroidetes bacterium]|nr:MAG: VOC family protein [Bacteroidota bacterium]
MNTPNDNYINYVEFRAKDLEKVKAFYTAAFDWKFTDYGPDYIAFSNSGLEGGFERTSGEIINGVLVVLYHKNLEGIRERVMKNGGEITKDIFSFPGGRRFHFSDPAGNELAIWSDKE